MPRTVRGRKIWMPNVHVQQSICAPYKVAFDACRLTLHAHLSPCAFRCQSLRTTSSSWLEHALAAWKECLRHPIYNKAITEVLSNKEQHVQQIMHLSPHCMPPGDHMGACEQQHRVLRARQGIQASRAHDLRIACPEHGAQVRPVHARGITAVLITSLYGL